MTSSIGRRFAFSVGTNLFRGAVSFVTGMLLARWLGPAEYGNMAFLLGTFLGLRQLLDLGSSSAFFTFLSQRPRSKRFVRGFFAWLAVQFVIPLCVIGLLFPPHWINAIWHGEHRGMVLLAFAAAFMQNSVWPVVQQAGESQRHTVRVQGVGLVVAAAHLLAVVLLWWLGFLGLYAIFAAITLEYLLAAVVAHRQFPYAPAGDELLVAGAPDSVFRRYLRFCLPLIPYSAVGFAYEFADRWLLQNYGGGVEQAYYAVGAQFAGISLIATTSILRIFWKEIAEAHYRGDHARTGRLYQKVSRLLFLIGAVIAGFLLPWSELLLRKFLGPAYVGGAMTLGIMFLYPVHQSMGQIGGTMLLASERTSVQVVIGIIFMTVSVGVTYLVLAPRNAAVPGLGLASEGLAVKMFVMQLIQVNVIAFIIARIWKWPFDWVYQPVSLLGCVLLGWVAHNGAASVCGADLALPLKMGLAGMMYLMLVGGFVYLLPSVTGLTRGEIGNNLGRAWRTALGTLREA